MEEDETKLLDADAKMLNVPVQQKISICTSYTDVCHLLAINAAHISLFRH